MAEGNPQAIIMFPVSTCWRSSVLKRIGLVLYFCVASNTLFASTALSIAILLSVLGIRYHFVMAETVQCIFLPPTPAPTCRDLFIGLASSYAFAAVRHSAPIFISQLDASGFISARRTAESLAAVIAVCRLASSARRIVRKLTDECRERSAALHLMRARAALASGGML